MSMASAEAGSPRNKTLANSPAFDATVCSAKRPTKGSEPERTLSTGTTIGRYVVLSRLGAGAMGVVFAAYDPQLDRKVALKLLRARYDSQAARTRLQREAQALAKLHHPNVVAVHDVGMHAGQLFVGMEFVAGQTLGEWMARGQHPWPEVLRVFGEAGRGLAAAHEAGLIHRDFKPDNVMLGDDGRVRVMDFGLARAKETGPAPRAPAKPETSPSNADAQLTGNQLLVSPLTQTGATMGTPAYMSPEQFEAERVDAASDQFSFCAALYEALYGERPFAGESLAELMLAVTEGQVLSAPRGAKIPNWIRKLVVRGLSTRPDQRWPSMQALLDALADDPAQRRRRWWAGAAALAVLVGGVSGFAYTLDHRDPTCAGMERELDGVWDDTRRASLQRSIAASELSYADDTWTRVEQHLDDYGQAWLVARVDACQASERGEQSDSLLDLRMACLDERLQHVQAIVEVLTSAEDGVINNAVQAVATLPRLEHCADTEALTAEVPLPEDPRIRERVATLDQHRIHAIALQNAGKYDDALALTDTLVAEASDLDYLPLRVRSGLVQADLQQRTGAYAEAEATLEQAYAAAMRTRMNAEAANASAQLVWVVGHRLARYEDGQRWAKHAEPLADATNTDEARALLLNHIGSLAYEQADYEGARAHWQQTLEIFERTLGAAHPSVATALNNLGNVAFSLAEYDRAQAAWERALAVREQALGASHPDLAGSLNGLGVLAKREGDYAKARQYYARALAIEEQALDPDNPGLSVSLNSLGNLAFAEADYTGARAYHQRALEIKERALGPDHPEVATSLNNLGNAASSLHDYAGARACFERALAILEASLGPDHPIVGITLDNLGLVSTMQGEFERARDYHTRGLAIGESTLGSDHPDNAYTLTGLGDALLGIGAPDQARIHLERALSLRTTHSAEPIELAKTRFALARALADTGEATRALELAEQAHEVFVTQGESSKLELEQLEAWRAQREQ